MIDQVLLQENEEVEALVAMLDDRPNEGTLGTDDSISYGSDDENYESIFAEILATASEEKAAQSGIWQTGARPEENKEHGETMDTTD